MARVIWKGAISFGLVLVPVSLYPASHEEDIDFDWLDQRTMDPVGYKRINKRTGREIDKTHIVKGVKQPDGDYVVLSEDEIRNAFPKTTQTIEIEAFVNAQEVSFVYLEKPYYLEPGPRAEKVYALLREAMKEAGVIGIARLVMHGKEHLAALVPAGQALMLDTLRWAGEIRPVDELTLPADGKSGAQLKDSELRMARQLIGDMTQAWKPDQYADRFRDAIQALIARKVQAGQTHSVEPLETMPEPAEASNVVDLTALLKQSLGQRKTHRSAEPPARKSTTTAASAGSATRKAVDKTDKAGKPTDVGRRASKVAAKTLGKTAAKKRA